MKDQVTLRTGDYVSTKGLTEADYHAVARAFMAAGAESGEYPSESERMARRYFGFGGRDMMEGKLCHAGTTGSEYWLNGRHLTPQQVVSATNAGGQPQDPLTTILEQAAEHDATARHHAAMHERLMAEAREMLPEGWRLVRAEDMAEAVSVDAGEWMKGSVAPNLDMVDPANWRAGDVAEVIDGYEDTHNFDIGALVRLIDPHSVNAGEGAAICEGLKGGRWWVLHTNLRFVYRP